MKDSSKKKLRGQFAQVALTTQAQAQVKGGMCCGEPPPPPPNNATTQGG